MKRFTLFIALCLTLAACNKKAAEYQAELFVFGTVVSLTAAGTDEDTASKAFAEIGRQFQVLHRDWHAWDPGELTRLNTALATGKTVTASPGIVDLVIKSRQMETMSGGRFNAALGGLVALWGFHTSQYPVLGPPPATEEIDKIIRSRPSALDVEVSAGGLTSANPMVQFDFGGIAKGAAVDIAVQILREYGIPAAIVNAGGDLRAYGNPGGEPWNIAVRAPAGGIIGGLEVRGDEAIFTSGNYQRFRQDDERRYAHILDPATGWPVEGVISTTVIAAEGWRADAAATALLIAGSQAFAQTAANMQIDAALLVDENGGLHLTPAMANRLKLVDSGAWQIFEHPGTNR